MIAYGSGIEIKFSLSKELKDLNRKIAKNINDRHKLWFCEEEDD
jgi:hypothetical protein